MSALRRRVRSSAWLALVAMVLSVLMPALSHGAAGADWVGVCTADGMRFVAVGADADDPAPSRADRGAGDHCLYCSLGAHGLLPTPAPTMPAPPAAGGGLVPDRFLSAPRTPHPWAAARPRGPPAAG